jgi:tRNA A37 threonylcarbamoyladenosine synthetase subunit TsaC/SUA5/YrdC
MIGGAAQSIIIKQQQPICGQGDVSTIIDITKDESRVLLDGGQGKDISVLPLFKPGTRRHRIAWQ